MYVVAKQVTINSTFFFLLFFPISDEPHGPLVLAIEPYQDQASGCPVTELDGKVAWVGTLQVHTPEVVTCGDVFAVFCLWGGEGWGRGTGWGKKKTMFALPFQPTTPNNNDLVQCSFLFQSSRKPRSGWKYGYFKASWYKSNREQTKISMKFGFIS